MVQKLLCEINSTESNLDLGKYISIFISSISLLISILSWRRSQKVTNKIGRPDIKVDYDTIDQTPGSEDKMYSVNIFLMNESTFKIRVRNIILATNGNLTNAYQIAYSKEWIDKGETRSYDWTIQFHRNQLMSNSLKLIVENEAGDVYRESIDLSGVNRGTAFHGKMN